MERFSLFQLAQRFFCPVAHHKRRRAAGSRVWVLRPFVSAQGSPQRRPYSLLPQQLVAPRLLLEELLLCTMATEDLCLVCTDSLDYTGFGPCGHKEACSRCVARVRFVMEDSRCMLCKQDSPAVFFTRYMGDYTHSLAPSEFVKLQVCPGVSSAPPSSKQQQAAAHQLLHAPTHLLRWP